MTDPLALRGIHLAARNLSRAFHDGHDLDARESMALAALLSGMTLTNAGLGAVHGLAAPLARTFPFPTAPSAPLCSRTSSPPTSAPCGPRHATCPVMSTSAANSRASKSAAENDAVDACVHFTANLLRELQIPPLGQFGLRPADVPEMIALARKSSSMKFNPIVLSDDSLSSALTAAIAGGMP